MTLHMKRLQPDTIRWSKIQKSYVRGIQSIFLILILLGTYTPNGQAQCTPIANAVPGVTLTYVQGGGTNATGVAYNPIFNVYYAAIAGNPGFPLETFDAAGTPLFQTNTGFDMRGLWWNFNLNQLESNGYNAGGIWSYDLNGTGYALNTGTSVFTGYNQPSVQSVGDYNCVDNEIWYYNAGSIMKRDRATNALIANLPITGLPVEQETSTTTPYFIPIVKDMKSEFWITLPSVFTLQTKQQEPILECLNYPQQQ